MVPDSIRAENEVIRACAAAFPPDNVEQIDASIIAKPLDAASWENVLALAKSVRISWLSLFGTASAHGQSFSV